MYSKKDLDTSLLTLTPAFLEWLDGLRNKNPLKGSNGGQNQNSVFVEIGKNLIVDAILEAREHAKNPPVASRSVDHGSDIMGKVTS